jgi:hypothetical protein
LASNRITCAFCATLNTATTGNCFACGAPLELPKFQPVTITRVPEPAVIPTALEDSQPGVPAQPIGDQVKEGLAAVGAGLGLAGIGGLLLRTLAEALAIAGAAIIIGFAAGSAADGVASFAWIALAGGALVGLSVGLVIKRSMFVLFSAPFGALGGVLLAMLFGLNTPGSVWLPLCATAAACVLAILGGRRNTSAGVFRVYQRIRPWLGLAGGVLFALIGYGIGRLF